MQNIFLCKILVVFLYSFIIIMIPLFLDFLFRITIRRKRLLIIKNMAKEKSRITNKPLIIFNDRYHGILFDNSGHLERFSGDIMEITSKMMDNCCVIVIIQTLEYLNEKSYSYFLEQIERISGGDFYFINLERKSPRILWDYKLNNIINNVYCLPHECNLTWKKPSKMQKVIQDFYNYLLKFLPIYFPAYESIDKIY